MATIDEMYNKVAQNSAKWHTATTQEEKDRLHQETVELRKQIDAASGSTSTFNPTSGTWTVKSGTPEQPKPASNRYDLSDQLRKQAAAEVESALADLKGAYTKGIAAYDAQQDKLPERYRAAMNSAAAQSAMAKKAFDEQAAASGLNSGASGQAALDASAVYQGNLSNLHQSRASDMAEIDRAKADLTAQYETAVAKAKAEGDASLAKALYQEMIRVQGLQREDDQIAYDRGRDTLADQRYDQQYSDSRADTEYERKAQSAAIRAQFGDFSGYAELWGIPQDTVNAMVAEYARQKQISEKQAALELEAQGLSNQLLAKQLASYGKSSSGNTSKKKKVIDDNGDDDPGSLDAGALAETLKNAVTGNMTSYFANGIANVKGKAADSGLADLNAKLAQMEDRTSVERIPTAAANLIKQELEAGRISEATAKRLLAQYGVG